MSIDHPVRFLGRALALAALLAACALQAPSTPGQPDAASPTLEGPPLTEARLEIAHRLGVPVNDIHLLSVETETWPDSSLGCPQPGEYYTQAQVPGYVILLGYGSQMYELHTGGGNLVLCSQTALPTQEGGVIALTPQTTPPGGSPMTPSGTVDASLQPSIDLAVADLAARLSLDPATIEVASAETVMWPDSSLGCPKEGMQYLQVLTDGYRITLIAEGNTYAYHGGRGKEPFLCMNLAP